MDIREAKVDGHSILILWRKGNCYFLYLIKNKPRQLESYKNDVLFLFYENFINALECNTIKGVDFGRRGVKITNTIYSHSKGAADCKSKHPNKGIKMDRTTKDLAASVPPKTTNHGTILKCALGLRYTICEQSSFPFSKIKRHWIYSF